jgi:hypothetical protein
MKENEPRINNPIDEILEDIKSLPKRWFGLPRKYRVLVGTLLYVLVVMFLVAAIKVSSDESNGAYFFIFLIGGLIIEGLLMPIIVSRIVGKK